MGECPLQYPECKWAFQQKEHLAKHWQTRTQAPPSPLACPEGQGSFCSKAPRRHLLSLRQGRCARRQWCGHGGSRLPERGAWPKGCRQGVKGSLQHLQGGLCLLVLPQHPPVCPHWGEAVPLCSVWEGCPAEASPGQAPPCKRPHSCTQCRRGFSQKQHLTKCQHTHLAGNSFQATLWADLPCPGHSYGPSEVWPWWSGVSGHTSHRGGAAGLGTGGGPPLWQPTVEASSAPIH